MKILWPDFHYQLSLSMSKTLEALGHTMLIPSFEAKEKPPQGIKPFVWRTWDQKEINAKFTTKNVRSVSKKELFDDPPDVVFIGTYEQSFEILLNIWPVLKDKKTKLAFYSGNDYVFAKGHHYPINFLNNYLCADFTGKTVCEKFGIKNWMFFQPPIDYDYFSFAGTSDSNIIGTYINDYKNCFPTDHKTYQVVKQNFTDYDFKLCENLSLSRVKNVMRESIGHLMIKGLEGYGMALIESCAVGRPAFLPRQYAQNKSYQYWMLENETAFYFSDLKELKNKLDAFYKDKEFRHFMQNRCAKRIRELVDNQKTLDKLKKFFENLS